MRKNQKVTAIFFELQSQLQEIYSNSDYLNVAAELARILDDTKPVPLKNHSIQRRTFDEMPLDHAMKDGGWRVLHREYCETRAFEEDADSYVIKRAPYNSIDFPITDPRRGYEYGLHKPL